MKHSLRPFARLSPIAALLCTAAVASGAASDLDLAIRSGGQSTVIVLPGETIAYQVVGELSDAQNEGLALFCFDLVYSGGDLAQAATPTAGPLLQFASPRGLTNPAGFGGTPVSGDLLQVGGAQNTIKNVFAPQPNGSVATGVALLGSPAVLAEGTLDAPLAPGIYVLSAGGLVANVIRQGEDGSGSFWAVDAAGTGTLQSLTIEVQDCTPSTYCTGKQSSQGCTPSIGSSGIPSLSGPGSFMVTCDDVINQQPGMWFFGTQPANLPFMGGVRCVATPIRRGPVMNSGGDSLPPQNCSGSFSFTLSQSFMLANGFSAGDQIYSQWWFRDRNHPDGTGVGLSNALQFTVCP